MQDYLKRGLTTRYEHLPDDDIVKIRHNDILDIYNFLEPHVSYKFAVRYVDRGEGHFNVDMQIKTKHGPTTFKLLIGLNNVLEDQPDGPAQFVRTHFITGPSGTYEICNSRLMEFLNYIVSLSKRSVSLEEIDNHLKSLDWKSYSL